MPINQLPMETIRGILRGGESVCEAAGIPVAGGHSIDSVEPIYGLVVIGLVHPDRVKRNAGAKPGDLLVLGKGLGVGIQSAALKKGELDAAGYAAMIASTTKLNTPGAKLSQIEGVHALTDVTGFGLLGHLLEVCRGSGIGAIVRQADVPVLAGVDALLAKGFKTGASPRNWAGYGDAVDLGPFGEDVKALFTDPQTSGGLLVACAPDAVDAVLALFHADGFEDAAVIGELVSGPSRVTLC
jgi:selenide, water dikinase